jgi:hypothetical protein
MVLMAMEPDEVAEQERISSALIGHSLTGVTYLLLNQDGPKPAWNGHGGESVDFGVALDFDGYPLSVGWIPPSNDVEGLMAAQDSVLAWRNLDAFRIDVGDSSRWSPVLASRLSAIRLDWREWSPSSSTSYLVGVHLTFVDHEIKLALAEIVRGRTVRSATNVAVIFDNVEVP